MKFISVIFVILFEGNVIMNETRTVLLRYKHGNAAK